jgi:hypothetical protein
MDPIAYDKYQEHLAHSAPCSSAWDGFDRGDDDHDLVDVDLDTDFVQVLDPELHALLIELNNLHDSHVLAWRAATGQDDIDF